MREDGARHEHVVDVRDDPVGVLDHEVEGHDGQEGAVQPADEEERDEAHGEEHRRVEAQVAAPHGGQPVEELDARGHRDEEREEREEGQEDGAGREHVVRPDREAQGPDRGRGDDEGPVAEERLAGEDRDDLADDAEGGQDEDVDLGVAEEPEDVLPEHRAAAQRRVEEAAAVVAVDEDR